MSVRELSDPFAVIKLSSSVCVGR